MLRSIETVCIVFMYNVAIKWYDKMRSIQNIRTRTHTESINQCAWFVRCSVVANLMSHYSPPSKTSYAISISPSFNPSKTARHQMFIIFDISRCLFTAWTNSPFHHFIFRLILCRLISFFNTYTHLS